MISSLIRVGGNTLVSRLLGFARDLLVARLFGADMGTDAFFVAFKVPNLFRRLFGEGAIAGAFIPALHAAEVAGGRQELRHLLASLSGRMGAGLILMTLIGVLAAPLLILIFAPGFAARPEQQALAGELLVLTLPYVAFIVLAALAGAALNLQGRFGVPAFTPVLLNLAIIGSALWLGPRLEVPILALGWGVLLGGLAQLAFLLPFLARLGLLPRPRLARPHPGTLAVLRRLGPVLIGGSVTQINLLLASFLASFLVTGSISWLYYAERLVEFPLGILGAALGIVILPRLSRLGLASRQVGSGDPRRDPRTDSRPDSRPDSRADSRGTGPAAREPSGGGPSGFDLTRGSSRDKTKMRAESLGGRDAAQAGFSRTLDWGLAWVLLLGLPATLGLVLLAEPLVATLFLSSEFGVQDMRMAAAGLRGYAWGLMAFMAIKVLVAAYFARGDTRSPLRLGWLTLALNLGLSLALMGPLGQAGLALATSLAAWGNAGHLLWGLVKAGAYGPGSDWGRRLGAALAGAAILAGLLVLGTGDLADWLRASPWERLVRLGLWMGTAGGVYLLVLWVLGVRFRDLAE